MVQVQTLLFMESEPAGSVIGELGGGARPLLLVLLLTLFCCALLQVNLCVLQIQFFPPASFQ